MRAVLRRRKGWPQPRSRNGGIRCDALGASPKTVQPVSYSRIKCPDGSRWDSHEIKSEPGPIAHCSTGRKKSGVAIWSDPNTVSRFQLAHCPEKVQRRTMTRVGPLPHAARFWRQHGARDLAIVAELPPDFSFRQKLSRGAADPLCRIPEATKCRQANLGST